MGARMHHWMMPVMGDCREKWAWLSSEGVGRMCRRGSLEGEISE